MITAVKNQNRHLRESCFPNRKSCAYDTERATLKANIAEMEKALEKVRDTKADIDRFAALIRKLPVRLFVTTDYFHHTPLIFIRKVNISLPLNHKIKDTL